jgi:predicted dehydrogenase
MDNLKIGLIGCGIHASKAVYPSLKYGPFDLVCTCAAHEASARTAAQRFGAERWYDDYSKMLEEEDLDACITVLPPAAYRDVITACLDAGLPVFAEKPGAETVEDAEAILAATKRSGKPVMIGFMKRFAPAYRQAKEISVRPDFGRVTVYTSKFAMGKWGPDRYNYVMDNALHHLDLARYFCGEVKRCTVEANATEEGRYAYGILLRFESGAVGLLNCCTTQSWKQKNEYAEITGVGQYVYVDNVDKCTYFPPERPSQVWIPNYTVPSEENLSLFTMGFAYELRHFAEAVSQSTEPEVTIADTKKDLELVAEVHSQGEKLRKG